MKNRRAAAAAKSRRPPTNDRGRWAAPHFHLRAEQVMTAATAEVGAKMKEYTGSTFVDF